MHARLSVSRKCRDPRVRESHRAGSALVGRTQRPRETLGRVSKKPSHKSFGIFIPFPFNNLLFPAQRVPDMVVP